MCAETGRALRRLSHQAAFGFDFLRAAHRLPPERRTARMVVAKLPPLGAFHEPQDKQQNDCTDRGCDDLAQHAAAQP